MILTGVFVEGGRIAAALRADGTSGTPSPTERDRTCRRAGYPHPRRTRETDSRASDGGAHGPRPTGCGGHTGRTESSAPTKWNKNHAKRDGENAVPCIIFTAYSAWPLCFMTDTTSSTQARQRASSGASTMTRSSGSVPDSRTRMRPVSPRRRATPSTAFCTAGS